MGKSTGSESGWGALPGFGQGPLGGWAVSIHLSQVLKGLLGAGPPLDNEDPERSKMGHLSLV